MGSRATGSGLSGVGARSFGDILPRSRKPFLKALNVETAGGDVIGGGNKAAIGWDVVDVHCTVKATVGRMVVSVCLALGKRFGENL